MKIEYIFIKKKNDFCTDKTEFINLLTSNCQISIKDNKINVGSNSATFTLEHESIENAKEDLFSLTIENTTENKIPVLETIDSVLRRINATYNLFYINTIFDEVSINYAIELYPKIINTENLLRKIIYLFMLKNLGSKWMQKHVPTDMQDSISKTLEKNHISEILVDHLYYADFITLGWFFFSKYALDTDYQKLISALKNPENHTQDKLDELLEKFEKKSNWDRYFSNKIPVDNLSEKWRQLYNYRNQVAHSKRISADDFSNANLLITELSDAFNNCLSHMNDVEMTVEQTEAVEKVAQESIFSTQPFSYTGLDFFNEDSICTLHDLTQDSVYLKQPSKVFADYPYYTISKKPLDEEILSVVATHPAIQIKWDTLATTSLKPELLKVESLPIVDNAISALSAISKVYDSSGSLEIQDSPYSPSIALIPPKNRQV